MVKSYVKKHKSCFIIVVFSFQHTHADQHLLMFVLTFQQHLLQRTPALLSFLSLGLISLPLLQNHLKLRLTAHRQPSVPPKGPKHKQHITFYQRYASYLCNSIELAFDFSFHFYLIYLLSF